VGHSKGCAKGKVYSYKYLHKKAETSQINNLTMHLKLLEKQEQTKLQTSRQREIIKIRLRSMKSKPNKLYKESMKQKVGSLKRLTRLTNP
jgi:hypothetical protein